MPVSVILSASSQSQTGSAVSLSQRIAYCSTVQFISSPIVMAYLFSSYMDEVCVLSHLPVNVINTRCLVLSTTSLSPLYVYLLLMYF